MNSKPDLYERKQVVVDYTSNLQLSQVASANLVEKFHRVIYLFIYYIFIFIKSINNEETKYKTI